MSAPEVAARDFLAALDAEKWHTVAELIHPDSAKRFRDQTLFVAQVIGAQRQTQPAETIFSDPLALIGAETLVQAEALSPSELVARWAQALHPANRERRARDVHSASHPPSPKTQLRLARTLLECTRTGEGSATACYRTEWYAADERKPQRSERQVLALAEVSGRWWVTDVDFTGEGTGHLVIPEPEWERLRNAFGAPR